MATKKNSPFAALIIGIILIIGSWFLYTNVSAPMTAEAKASDSWPNVPGIITHSDISQSTDDGKTMYATEINYNFNIGNNSYSGNRISLTSNNTKTSNIGSVKKTLQKYPVGQQVTVYYDPELPNNAVLQPGADTFTYIIKYAPFLLGFLGVLMLLQLLKKLGIVILALFLGTRK